MVLAADSLLDDELFAHCKGAFTGAAHSRVGALEAVDGGTVFLEEIGELPLAMQPKGEANARPQQQRFNDRGICSVSGCSDGPTPGGT